jgi:tetratricopeptide (TPR) repeat protein
MDPRALELMRLLQSDAYDAATIASVRASFPEVRAGLEAAGDTATIEEIHRLLGAWAEVAAPAERAEALVLVAAMVEGAERARVLRTVGQLRLEQAGDVDEAIAVYEEALDADAEVTLTRELADLYALRGAEGDGERAADLYAAVADLVGGADALALVERALGLAPGNTEALALLEATVPEGERATTLRERWEAYVAATTDETGAAERRLALARADGAAKRYRDALLWIAPLVDRGDPTAQKLKESFLAGLASAAVMQGASSAAHTPAVDRPLPARALSPRSGQTMVGFKVPAGVGVGDATMEAVERARRALEAQASAAEEARQPPRAAAIASTATAPGIQPAPAAAARVAAKATMVGRNPLAPAPAAPAAAKSAPVRDPLAPAAVASAPAGTKAASATKPEFAATMMGVTPGQVVLPTGRVSGVEATMPAIVFPSGIPPASLAPPAHRTAAVAPISGTATGLGQAFPGAAPTKPVSSPAPAGAPGATASWPPVAPRASAPAPAAAASWPPVAPRASVPVAGAAAGGGSPPGSSVPAPSLTVSQPHAAPRASVPLVFPTEGGPRPSAVRAPHVDTGDFTVPRRGIPWPGKPVFIGAGAVLLVGVLYMMFSGGDEEVPAAAPAASRTSSVPAVDAPAPPVAAPTATPAPSAGTAALAGGAAAPAQAAAEVAELGEPTPAPSGSAAVQPSPTAKTTGATGARVGAMVGHKGSSGASPSGQPAPDGRDETPEPTGAKGAPSADDVEPASTPRAGASSGASAKGKPAVDLATGPARVKGKLTVKDVVSVLQPKLSAFKRCYARALDRNAKLDGRLMLQWSVNAKGRSGTVKKVSGSTLNDAKLVSCEAEIIRNARFPAPASEVRMGFDHSRR